MTTPLHPISHSTLSLPPDSYIYTILPLTPRSLPNIYTQPISRLAALSSDSSVRLIDTATLSLLPGGLLKDTHSSATCLAHVDSTGNLLGTCGRDGGVKVWDTRSSTPLASTIRIPNGLPLSALTFSTHAPLMAAGVEVEANPPSSAPVYLFDLRNTSSSTSTPSASSSSGAANPPSTPLLTLEESHNDTITTLQFHPSHANLLLSASTDNLLNISRIDQPTEEDALHQIINHKGAVAKAGFLQTASTLSEGKVEDLIYALGTEETLSLHALQSLDEGVEEPMPRAVGDLRGRLGCEYVVGIYHSSTTSQDLTANLVLGKHSHSSLRIVPWDVQGRTPGDVQVPEGHEGGLECLGAHGSEIVRDVVIDGLSETVFTCGEDGMVRAWRAAEGSGSASASAGTAKEKNKAAREAKKEKEGRRFNPY